MSRRSVLIATMRRNAKKQGAPRLIILPGWASRDGEPLVTWTLDARTPTKEEIAAAIAQWKREQDTQRTTKPGQGAGEEEN